MTPTDAVSGVDAGNDRDARRWSLTATLCALLGAALVLWIVLQVPGEVFNNGDGGLKALQAKQAAAGDFGLGLHLPAPQWVRAQWMRGHYPFEPPFVYPMAAGHPKTVEQVPTFPFLFPWLSALPYRALGFRGFFVLPALALFALWACFWLVARRAGVPVRWRAVALASLVLASPLTPYGAMFYEHTLTVLLLFPACAVAALPPRQLTARRLALAGALAGIAPWMRAESWCLLAGLGLLAALRLVRERDRRWAWLPAGALLTAGADLVANHALYGSWFGPHGELVLRTFSLQQQLARAIHHLGSSLRQMAVFEPLLLALVAAVAAVVASRRSLPRGALAVAGLVVFDLAAVPFVLPVSVGLHWGPRYLLVLMPLLSLLLSLLLPALAALPRLLRLALGCALAVALGFGAWKNSVEGTRQLVDNYRHRVWPALAELQAAPDRVVVVNDSYCSTDLAALLADKPFLLAHGAQDLGDLASVLARRGQPRFLFVVFPFQPMPPRFAWGAPDRRTACAVRGERGQFLLYDCAGTP
ncbi:MAG TPA: hypothetical protein VFS60_03610 [Thermoanaerobaculia bacterium]|nr:hypothetical protein [Thermoanaerobaculia bacterium]